MIRFDKVSFTHLDGTEALKNIDVEIRSGEVTAIVGENGAGKTTLIKHINGLLKPTKGVVKVFDLNTKETSVAKLSRKVGVVFQNPDHQLFSESVRAEITFGLKNFGFPDDLISRRLDWALSTFNLEGYKDISPLMLSGGEKKRLCLAMVLAWDPDVIILDEPTVGQDYAQKEKLVQMIGMLVSQGKTVIAVSHDIEFVWSFQPRVLVMAKGMIIGDGAASEVFGDSDLLKRANVIRPQLLELASRLPIKPDGGFSDIFAARRWILQNLRRG